MNDVNLTLVLASAALIGCGVYLLLERSLSRVLVGLVLMGNGVALGFLVASGPAGEAPIMVDGVEAADISDPLPQAMVLTAIVIMLATTAFVLAMGYRSWQLNGNDDVQDDPEDALIRRLATHDTGSEFVLSTEDDHHDEEEESSDFAEGELHDPDDEFIPGTEPVPAPDKAPADAEGEGESR